ncbi:hypothetical protein PanWU01x14_186720 [Parasponia andersonii]|uniref:Uncharacterized protein n=1 Tax=Parasponia andersonii TaxID=3476 RepID=A0A2P5C3Q1_PARAD|nr:hypothetical protein PanWU01x14_186720 [Parasponia andersonii]
MGCGRLHEIDASKLNIDISLKNSRVGRLTYTAEVKLEATWRVCQRRLHWGALRVPESCLGGFFFGFCFCCVHSHRLIPLSEEENRRKGLGLEEKQLHGKEAILGPI